ncbi:helix-turn-helix transcriptional regulator [Echinicola rosea]|uniref:HTH araC/xylS-type domain-containing protein n=1 Tax=Echinicola rosea TaxID=1807691 RepID=A0ABQ1VAV4_9BACT|nr:helix-turn-helix transcriptional regulator [Echinicola rosea]GGF50053.1 hypothetical protein GCM10011339_43260 [Echinicola rosea]
MYIDSKLRELDLEVFHLSVPQKTALEIQREEVAINRSEVGVRSSIFFDSRFFLVESFIRMDQDLTDIYSLMGDFVHLSFTHQGKPSLKESHGQKSEVNQGMVQLSYQKDFSGQFYMKKDSEVHYYSIILERQFFLELLQKEDWAVKRPFFQAVKKREEKGFGLGGYFPVNSRVLSIIKELRAICESSFSNENKQSYLVLKFRELFFNVYISQTDQAMNGGVSVPDEINKAKAILASSYINPPTIRELSKLVLLNELKLKQEFKRAFGITIRGFVIKNRMDLSLGFLKEGKQVGEVAELLGYNNVSYFINTFRKYYGQTPKQALKSNSDSFF